MGCTASAPTVWPRETPRVSKAAGTRWGAPSRRAARADRTPLCPRPPPPTEEVEEWKVVCGKFLAINSTNMSCACPRSPRGLSPAAHLGDGSCDLILIRKCSRFNFLRFLVRHTNQCDQVGAGRPCAPAPT